MKTELTGYEDKNYLNDGREEKTETIFG